MVGALATGLVLVVGLETLGLAAFVCFAVAFGAGVAGFLTAAFFTEAVLVAFGLAVGFAAFFGLALIGLALDTGFAVFFAADFFAEFLEGISSFAAEERDI